MTHATLDRPRHLDHASELLTAEPVASRPALLVATDGTPSADAAIHAAHCIAARTGQLVELLAVHPPVPMVSAEVQLASTPEIDADACRTLHADVCMQLARLRMGTDWPLDVRTGDPAATIVKVAQEKNAGLIVMGLGGHGIVDRILGDELVLRVLRLGTIPVFAVAPTFLGLPSRAVAAVDFSRSSVRAVRSALDLLSPGGTLAIAHVVSRDLDPTNWTDANAGYSGTIGRTLDRVIADSGAGNRLVVSRKVVAGDPAKEVLRLADASRAQLIIAGSHGHNFLTRLLLGSVSTRLVRSATCSVLVAPPEEGPDYIEELPEVTDVFGFYEWAERLEEFSRRNASRLATLEVIDPEIGAQVEGRDLVLLGTSFDPRDGCVHIMFGGRGGPSHLTRRIGGVTAIQTLRDREGQDLLLRVAHGRGQTLVTLSR